MNSPMEERERERKKAFFGEKNKIRVIWGTLKFNVISTESQFFIRFKWYKIEINNKLISNCVHSLRVSNEHQLQQAINVQR